MLGSLSLEDFIENHLKIMIYSGELIDFNLRSYQKTILNTIEDNHRSIILGFRQSGLSTLYATYSIWKCLANNNYRVVYYTNHKGFLNSYHIPNEFKNLIVNNPSLGNVKFSNRTIQFPNGSYITIHSTSESLRGCNPDLIIVDDLYNPTKRQDISRDIELIRLLGKCKIVLSSSSINSSTWFESIWNKANEEIANDFVSLLIDHTSAELDQKQSIHDYLTNHGRHKFNIAYECGLPSKVATLNDNYQ